MGSTQHPPPPSSFKLSALPSLKWYRVHPIDPKTGHYTPDAYNTSG